MSFYVRFLHDWWNDNFILVFRFWMLFSSNIFFKQFIILQKVSSQNNVSEIALEDLVLKNALTKFWLDSKSFFDIFRLSFSFNGFDILSLSSCCNSEVRFERSNSISNSDDFITDWKRGKNKIQIEPSDREGVRTSNETRKWSLFPMQI